MSRPSFLTKIEELTHKRVGERKKNLPFQEFKLSQTPSRFLKLLDRPTPVFIAEIKKKSPSLGELNLFIDPATLAYEYGENGADAISVLTEPDYFNGSLNDLIAVRASNPDLPILQKDFVVDEYQIYEARHLGADAVLLIVSLLGESKTKAYYELAMSLGLVALVEVHDLLELEYAIRLGAKFIGINNRNLHTLDVSLDVSRFLITHVPKDVLIISESGIRTPQECRELQNLGFKGFLIGSSFMMDESPAHKLRSFVYAS